MLKILDKIVSSQLILYLNEHNLLELLSSDFKTDHII